jgi:hypothetical protein
MRNCKRCKTNESIKGSLNCSSCDERNKRHTAKMIADSNAKVSYSKPLTEYGSLKIEDARTLYAIGGESNTI